MPYKDLEKKRAAQKRAAKRYALAHPTRVAKQKSDWYKSNRKKELRRVAKWRRDNPDGEFNAYLRRKYGLTRERYDQMLAEQGGVCGICKGPPRGRARSGKAHTRFDVDHCHKTGKVRGLLCHACNVMLGQAEDKAEVLQAAIFWVS